MRSDASSVSTQTAAQFIEEVSGQNHAMAGAVIALSAAQAAALGQACMQISLDELDVDGEGNPEQIERMAQIKSALLRWSERDADAIAKFVALREAGETLAGQQLLCSAPADVSRMSIEAADISQNFRPLVNERVYDDLEMSISLLSGTAQAALLLLDSNLRIWPDEPLLAEFEPVVEELAAGIAGLSPAKRIREEPI